MTCGQRICDEIQMLHEDGSPGCVVNGTVYMERNPEGEEVCDFCCGPKPNWTLLTEPFEIDMLLADDDGTRTLTHSESPEWACCGDCKRLIESDRWDKVAEKAIRYHESLRGRLDPGFREQLRGLIEEMHGNVRDRWIGSIVRSAGEVEENP